MLIFGGNLEEILVHNHNIPTSLLCVTRAEGGRSVAVPTEQGQSTGFRMAT